jgi:hypothetical protein
MQHGLPDPATASRGVVVNEVGSREDRAMQRLALLASLTLVLGACDRQAPLAGASHGGDAAIADGGESSVAVDAAWAGSSASTVLFAPNPHRAEFGILARHPGFRHVNEVAGRIVLDQCYFGNAQLVLKVLELDGRNGTEISVPVKCDKVLVVGDLLVVWSTVKNGTHYVHEQRALRIPSGEVIPYPLFDAQDFIGGEEVLSQCGSDGARTLRILDADRLHGRDIATGKSCEWRAYGVLADAIILGVTDDLGVPGDANRGLVAVHIPSGRVEPYVKIPGRAEPEANPRAEDQVMGITRYRRDKGKDSKTPDPDAIGLSAYDARSADFLWHRNDVNGMGVPSEGTLVVLGSDSVAEVDPADGHVLWELGAASATAPLVKLSIGGADAVAFTDAQPGAPPRTVADEVLILARGAPSAPAWTGTSRGSYHGNDDQCGHTPDHPLAHRNVWVGAKMVTTDAHGKFSITTTAHGSITVAVHGIPFFSQKLDLDAAKAAYDVDVTQAWGTDCWPSGYTK